MSDEVKQKLEARIVKLNARFDGVQAQREKWLEENRTRQQELNVLNQELVKLQGAFDELNSQWIELTGKPYAIQSAEKSKPQDDKEKKKVQ